MRFMILFLLVLTFSPFDIEDGYFFTMFQFEEVASLESENSEEIGEYRCDSQLHCIATAGGNYTYVIWPSKESGEVGPISLILIPSPAYFEVFHPPRA